MVLVRIEVRGSVRVINVLSDNTVGALNVWPNNDVSILSGEH